MVILRALMFSALLWSETGHAADWPHYRGPNRDGISAETGLLQQWPEGGPPLRWIYTNAGIGYGPCHQWTLPCELLDSGTMR